MEVICAILEEKYHVEAEIKEPTVIYMERPLRKAEYTIHIEVPPNPFWASVGLSIEPLPIGSGVQYESRVSLGYLNQSFQNAVMEGVLYGCEQGLYGWKEAEEFITQHGTIVKTPSGYWQQVPQVSIAQTYLKIMNKFCEQFGLTPSARSRISTDSGEDKQNDEMELLLVKGVAG